jgi:hypothetical protein
MKKIYLFLFLFVFSIFANDVPQDPKLVDLLTKFCEALKIADENERVKAILPYVHDYDKTKDKTDLIPNTKQFSFKKASNGISRYEFPLVITRVEKTGDTSYQGVAGSRFKYFIKKNQNFNGMPAPIHIFVPADGSEPKVINFGSI